MLLAAAAILHAAQLYLNTLHACSGPDSLPPHFMIFPDRPWKRRPHFSSPPSFLFRPPNAFRFRSGALPFLGALCIILRPALYTLPTCASLLASSSIHTESSQGLQQHQSQAPCSVSPTSLSFKPFWRATLPNTEASRVEGMQALVGCERELGQVFRVVPAGGLYRARVETRLCPRAQTMHCLPSASAQSGPLAALSAPPPGGHWWCPHAADNPAE